jgi:uncharacterized protein (DUF433 family)
MKLTSQPDIMGGLVCFAGTRIPVETVWAYAAEGFGVEYILLEYPALDRRDVEAALALVEWSDFELEAQRTRKRMR